jgi:hypothetical protein
VTRSLPRSAAVYRKTSSPFDFLAVAQLAYPGMLHCCEAPRPSCLLFKDLAAWAEQDWRCLSCDKPIDPWLFGDTRRPARSGRGGVTFAPNLMPVPLTALWCVVIARVGAPETVPGAESKLNGHGRETLAPRTPSKSSIVDGPP